MSESDEPSKTSQLKSAKAQRFLKAFALTANKVKAAEIAGCERHLHQYWMNQEGEEGDRYHGAYELAKAVAGELLESEATRRAVKGVEEPVFYQGEKCGEVQKYSDTLLIFLLKAARPEKYRERVSQELTGAGGGPITMATLLTLARQAKADGNGDADPK